MRGGKTIHISGQVSLDERGQVVGVNDLKAQTELATAQFLVEVEAVAFVE